MKKMMNHGYDKTTLGFWIYLMTDCVLFASLFATYAVLHGATAGGAGPKVLFDIGFVFWETLLLLASSLTAGIALLSVRFNKRQSALVWMFATLGLGAGFLAMEVYEFSQLVAEGHGWWSSAFLSSYFTLVGTHGIHIAIGLLWLVVIMYLLYRRGITNAIKKRVMLFSLFWHFLDIIWILIFTLVYLLGVTL